MSTPVSVCGLALIRADFLLAIIITIILFGIIKLVDRVKRTRAEGPQVVGEHLLPVGRAKFARPCSIRRIGFVGVARSSCNKLRAVCAGCVAQLAWLTSGQALSDGPKATRAAKFAKCAPEFAGSGRATLSHRRHNRAESAQIR